MLTKYKLQIISIFFILFIWIFKKYVVTLHRKQEKITRPAKRTQNNFLYE